MVSAIYHKTGTGIMDNDYNSKSTQELADGLALYLKQGYINPLYFNWDCEDEGAEEAGFIWMRFLYVTLIYPVNSGKNNGIAGNQ